MSSGPPPLHSLEPAGWTGGRIYLPMIHDAVGDMMRIATLPDPKRSDRQRHSRMLRHLICRRAGRP